VHRFDSDRSLRNSAQSYLRNNAGQDPNHAASNASPQLRSAKTTRAPEVSRHTLLSYAVLFSSFRCTSRLRSTVNAGSNQSVHVQHCGGKLLAAKMAEPGYADAQANLALFEGAESDEQETMVC
jgi:hypothetical protein